MAQKITGPNINGQYFVKTYKPGRKPLPSEIKAVRVNITLSPQARKRGQEIARSCGRTFSA